MRRYLANTTPNVDLTANARTPTGSRPFADIQSLVETMRSTFAFDIDGDNASNEKDALLLIRALLGFSGASITNGLTLTSSPRSQWSDMRTWLNTNCGTSFSQ
jgi:hypothetical protein